MLSLHPARRSRRSGRIRRSAWCRSGSTGSTSPARNSRGFLRCIGSASALSIGPVTAVAAATPLTNCKWIDSAIQRASGGSESPSREAWNKCVHPRQVPGQRARRILGTPVDRLFRLVGLWTAAQKPFQAHVTDHLQLVDEDPEQFGHRFRAVAIECVARSRPGPKRGKTIGFVPGGADIGGDGFDIVGDSRAIGAAIGIVLAGKRLGAVAVTARIPARRALAWRRSSSPAEPGRQRSGPCRPMPPAPASGRCSCGPARTACAPAGCARRSARSG